MDRGVYLISHTIDIRGKSASIVSSQTLAEFHTEVGVGYQNANRPSKLDASFLLMEAEKARKLVDSSVYEHHLKKLPTLVDSRNKRHRLVELSEYARTVAGLIAKEPYAPVELDGNLISELVTLNSLFDRWKNHPAWDELKKALVNSNDVQHSLVQLLTASYLADHGNGVGIIFGAVGGGRIPDLYVRPTVSETMQIEVKTPVALRGPIGTISDSRLRKTIEDHLNKAASSSHGQLDTTQSGILAIGAFHLNPGVLDRMERITQSILSKQSGRKPHLAAVVIAVQNYTEETALTQAGTVLSRSFTPSAEFRIAKHPGYRGSLKLDS